MEIKFDIYNISDKFELIGNYKINNMNIARKIYVPKKHLDKYIGSKYEEFISNTINYDSNVFNIRKCEIKNNYIKNIIG